MPSTAIDAQDALVEIDTTTQGTPDTEIANVNSFSGFDGESTEIDVTNLRSAAKEYRVGLKDFGGFNMEINPDFNDAGQNALRSAGNNIKTFRITLENGTTLTFQGLVKNASSMNAAVDGVITGTVSVRITGDVVVGNV
jgi:hypothetical protein